MTSIIKNIYARQIFDSRGNPTIAVDVCLENGTYASANVPSGASTGTFEAVELRDGGDTYCGKGVSQAINNVHKYIAPALKGMCATQQANIDAIMIELDGTDNKSRLGANAILGVSLAVAKAGAIYHNVALYRYLGGVVSGEIPMPMFNVLNGGAHADNDISIQEFMIVPVGANNFHQAMEMGTRVYHELKKKLMQAGLNTNVGDEGGFAPNLKGGARSALDLIMTAIEKAGYKPEEDIALALDVAANELYKLGIYTLDGKEYDGEALISYYQGLVNDFPIISIEDPLAEEDWQNWCDITEKLGDTIHIIGDDLLVTNPLRLIKGIELDAANSILIKPNQIGTLTETIDVITTATKHGWGSIVSHRSGDTEDTFIADLAVACNVDRIKTGAPCRSERMAKYNRLLQIEWENTMKIV